MVDSSWEWTILSLLALVVGTLYYRNVIKSKADDLYNQWNTPRPNDQVSEELDYGNFDDDKPPVEEMLLSKTKARTEQGFSHH
ncbi:MAG: hypothetical protein V4668_01305 [Patescibacteria group bacterium]